MNIVYRIGKGLTVLSLITGLFVALSLNTANAQQSVQPPGPLDQTDTTKPDPLETPIPGGVTAPGLPLSDVIMLIQQLTKAQFVLGEGAGEKQVNFQLTGDPTLRTVLDSILQGVGLDYFVEDNGIIRIDTQEKILQFNTPETELITRRITPRYIAVEVLEAALQNLKSPDGVILIDTDSQRIIVTDLPEVVEEMMRIVEALDVPIETRIFPIKYGNAQEIADQLQGIIQTGEGELIVDYRNNLIMIKDTVDRLDMAEAIIERLDVELKPVIIPLKFSLPEDIIPLAETLLTENGYIDFDIRTSRLIVRDIPSAVEQIKELIELLDIPTRQVWVEVDIVKINNDKSLTMGVSADFGSDIGKGGEPSAPNIGSATGGGNFFTFNPFLSTSGSGLTLMDVNKGSYRIQIDAMVDRREAEVVASPRLMIKDGEIGAFTLGSQEPYSVRQQQSSFFGGGGDYFTQQFREVGTTVEFEVYASEAGYIEMFINVEDTSSRRVDLDNVGTGLAVDGSFVQTAVTVKSGRTVVLGGIINRDKSRTNAGVPVLSSIPVLGNLFKRKTTGDNNQKMLIFITPKMVNIDNPYDFAQVDNIERIKSLRSSGATGFIDSEVADKYIDWSNEEENEKAALEEFMREQNIRGSVETSPSGRRASNRRPSIDQQYEEGVMRVEE